MLVVWTLATVLSLVCFWRISIQEWRALYRERQALSMVTCFLGALLLLLGGAHPAQPFMVDMDLVVFAVTERQMPALAQVAFADAFENRGQLIPIHARVPRGGLALWITMSIAGLLLLLPSFRRDSSSVWIRRLHFLPIAVLGTTASLWIFAGSSTYTEDRFQQYLTYFDLPPIGSVHFPNEQWHLDLNISLAIVVFVSLGAALILLLLRESEPSGRTLIVRTRQFETMLLALLLVYVLIVPHQVTFSQLWLLVIVTVFGVMSTVESHVRIRVWSAFGCVVGSGLVWVGL